MSFSRARGLDVLRVQADDKRALPRSEAGARQTHRGARKANPWPHLDMIDGAPIGYGDRLRRASACVGACFDRRLRSVVNTQGTRMFAPTLAKFQLAGPFAIAQPERDNSISGARAIQSGGALGPRGVCGGRRNSVAAQSAELKQKALQL